MTDAATALHAAMQPLYPHTTIEYMPGDTDITIVVYSADFATELHRAECTFSFAAQYIAQGDRFIWDEEEVGQNEFAVLHAQGPIATPTPKPAPAPLTCSIGDIVDAIQAELAMGGSDMVTVTVGPATWLVKR